LFNFDNALLALSFYRDGGDWTSGKIAMRSPRTEPFGEMLRVCHQTAILRYRPGTNKPGSIDAGLAKIFYCGVRGAAQR
jgi:hypothetical protein